VHEYTYITQAPAHLSIIIDYAQQNLQPTFTDNKQGSSWQGTQQHSIENMAALLFWKNKFFRLNLKESRVSAGEEEKGHSM